MVKRGLDVLASLCGMIVFSPLFFIVWLAVRLEDGGPAIFSQQRVGYRGRDFTLYKFRSMVVSSEADGQPALCQKNDARLTRVGRFLRDHHLDELPQLWNVLRGDMSFVGPRPERRFFVDRIMAVNPDYELLYQLRPGLFSSATLYNGSTDTLNQDDRNIILKQLPAMSDQVYSEGNADYAGRTVFTGYRNSSLRPAYVCIVFQSVPK